MTGGCGPSVRYAFGDNELRWILATKTDGGGRILSAARQAQMHICRTTRQATNMQIYAQYMHSTCVILREQAVQRPTLVVEDRAGC